MAMSKKVKIEIAVLAVVVVLIVAVIYISFVSPRLARKSVFTTIGVSSETGEDSVVRELADLKMQVLSDKTFEALVQYSSLPVNPGERGIANPFGGSAPAAPAEAVEGE